MVWTCPDAVATVVQELILDAERIIYAWTLATGTLSSDYDILSLINIKPKKVFIYAYIWTNNKVHHKKGQSISALHWRCPSVRFSIARIFMIFTPFSLYGRATLGLKSNVFKKNI